MARTRPGLCKQSRIDRRALEPAIAAAQALGQLNALIVAKDGVRVVDAVFRGPPRDRAVNVKSVSRVILASLVGIAIVKGHLTGVDQTVALLLGDRVPDGADPWIASITVGHLLSLRSSFQSTFGRDQGRWTASRDWVAFALAEPFEDDPGGRMICVVPDLGLTAVMTSDADTPSGRTGYVRDLHRLLIDHILPAVAAA